MNAHAGFIGFGYYLWRRTRWMVLATLGQIIVLTVAARWFGPAAALPLVTVVVMSLMVITVPLFVQAFSFGGDFGGMESGFPRHMMVLPLRASMLTAAPMLYAIAFVAGLWIVVWEFVLVPLKIPLPALWSMLIPVTAMAWLCATSWMPFWLPFGRIIACIGALFAIAAFTATMQIHQMPEWITNAGLLGATAVAFAAAANGVARARRGDGTTPPWRLYRSACARPIPALEPFASAARAQIWFELRRNCTLGTIFVLAMMFFLAFPLLWQSNQHIDLVDFYFVTITYITTAIFLLAPVVFLGIIGGNIGRPDAWKDSTDASAFLTARPMNDRFIIVAKIKATAITIVFVWTIVLGLLGLSMLIPHGDTQTESPAHFLLRHATPWHVLLAVASLAGLVLQSWLMVIKSFSLNLYGGKWLPLARMSAAILLFALILSLGQWVSMHSDYRATVHRAVQVSMCLLIAAKIGLALPIVRALRQRQIATSAQLAASAALWFLAAAALFGVTFWLIPAARHSSLLLAAGVGLLVPYNRMISMPLAWHHNRHR